MLEVGWFTQNPTPNCWQEFGKWVHLYNADVKVKRCNHSGR
jgi:hypothetical protein